MTDQMPDSVRDRLGGWGTRFAWGELSELDKRYLLMEALDDAQAIARGLGEADAPGEVESAEWALSEAGLELHVTYGGIEPIRRLIVALVNAHEAEVAVAGTEADAMTWQHLLARSPQALAQQLVELLGSRTAT